MNQIQRLTQLENCGETGHAGARFMHTLSHRHVDGSTKPIDFSSLSSKPVFDRGMPIPIDSLSRRPLKEGLSNIVAMMRIEAADVVTCK